MFSLKYLLLIILYNNKLYKLKIFIWDLSLTNVN